MRIYLGTSSSLHLKLIAYRLKVIEAVRFLFPPPSRGRLGGDCITNISSILYMTIPL